MRTRRKTEKNENVKEINVGHRDVGSVRGSQTAGNGWHDGTQFGSPVKRSQEGCTCGTWSPTHNRTVTRPFESPDKTRRDPVSWSRPVRWVVLGHGSSFIRRWCGGCCYRFRVRTPFPRDKKEHVWYTF